MIKPKILRWCQLCCGEVFEEFERAIIVFIEYDLNCCISAYEYHHEFSRFKDEFYTTMLKLYSKYNLLTELEQCGDLLMHKRWFTRQGWIMYNFLDRWQRVQTPSESIDLLKYWSKFR
jgi:hypothetical protein